MADIPDDLDAFLGWFKLQTEVAWARHRTTPFEEFEEAGVGGRSWRTGTVWQTGLAANEIDAIEQQWDLRFPAPYRTFLSNLNAPDRGMYSVGWAGDESEGLAEFDDESSFYDWRRDSEELTYALEHPLDGLLFDVEHNDLWLNSWGTKPEPSKIPACLAELIAAAPALIPIYGHRYLLDHKVGDDYPVLSVHQSDIIFYGSNLRNYLLLDLDGLIGPTPGVTFEAANSGIEENDVKAIPFWGELMLMD